MLISPFTPLFFYPSGKKPKSDGVESPYIQTFATTDRILIECLCSSSELVPAFSLINAENGAYVNLELNSLAMSGGTILRFAILKGLTPGIYKFYIPNYNMYSYEFRIGEEDELKDTTLIQYSMKDNKSRSDAVWLINGKRHFFDFRVPGGFKDSEMSFGCESEQFVTQQGDICTLYARESTQCKFTLGGAEGVPARFAELLNRLLCCTYVYFDGVRYARKEGSVPELNQQIEGVDSFVFKQILQKVSYLNPAIENVNLALLRHVDSESIRVDETNYNLIIR